MRMTLLGILMTVAMPVWAGTPLPDAPHIVISGEGRVSVPAERARVTMNFEQRASTPLAAKQAVDQAVSRYLATLTAYKVEDGQVRASDLSVREEFDYDDNDRRVSRGHLASREVSVVLDAVARLNDLLDDGLKAGASGVGDISFEVRDAQALRAGAKAKAVAEARRKADETASAFGTRLGKVYSIDSVNSRMANQWGANTLDRMQVTGTRLPGRYLQSKVEFTESVSAVFELER